MAKTLTAKKVPDAKNKNKAAPGATVKIRLKARKDGKGGKSDKKAKGDGFEGLAKFVDHPLVADLLAAGAIAAVAAIADHRAGKGKGHSASKMVKSVGKAAAVAMGQRLIADIGAITTAATAAAKKA